MCVVKFNGTVAPPPPPPFFIRPIDTLPRQHLSGVKKSAGLRSGTSDLWVWTSHFLILQRPTDQLKLSNYGLELNGKLKVRVADVTA